MSRAGLPPLVLFLVLSVAAHGQAVYPTTPDWVSQDDLVGTGGALADLNRDGWLDLIVSAGNDMEPQPLVVYYNNGDGTYPPAPNWESTDLVFNGHLDIADVDADGWLDVAVATLGEFDTFGPVARVYFNQQGTLQGTPGWTADLVGNAFGIAFGDMNNDGRPDLAVGTGWAYSPEHPYVNVVYLNEGGALSATPAWTSADTQHLQGVCWVDADGDGWLDLAGAAASARSRVYCNNAGLLDATSCWQLTDVATQDAIMVTAGDVTGDGRPDLLIADNKQLPGSGRFRQYSGVTPGTFATTANWAVDNAYCSAVALADVDADGDLDLATGAWWNRVRLYRNTGMGLPQSPSWTCGVSTVVERILFGDIDRDGLRTLTQVYAAPGQRRLFYLPHQPIEELVRVEVDGVPLTPARHTGSRELGWVSIGVTAAAEVRITYRVSSRVDMAVTNWDRVGCHVYRNRHLVRGDANCDGRADFDDIDPFVLLLAGGYESEFPGCGGRKFCDMDGNGRIDFDDIDGFVAVLGGG